MRRRPTIRRFDEEDQETSSDESGRRHSSERARRSRRAPVARWAAEADEQEDGEALDEESARTSRSFWHRPRRPVFFRARDAWYFEPLVALAILIILLVSLFAYTQNWPPIYVVISNSMQHGPNDRLGLINTGDIVLAQRIDSSRIVPYVSATQTRYSTYGELGDVILYHPDGFTNVDPVIHRALLYLNYSPSLGYTASDLVGLPCGNATNSVFTTLGSPQGPCATRSLPSSALIQLHSVGWQHITLNLSLSGIGAHSGFVTLGDNNAFPDQNVGISSLVDPAWIIGVARGMIPWFGSVTLLLEGQASEVPSGSWELLGLTIAGAIVAAFGIHYALRAEGIEDERRRALEEEESVSASGEDTPSLWYRLTHPRRADGEGDDDEEDEDRPRHRRRHLPAVPRHHGRPKPSLRASSHRRNRSGETDADEL